MGMFGTRVFEHPRGQEGEFEGVGIVEGGIDYIATWVAVSP